MKQLIVLVLCICTLNGFSQDAGGTLGPFTKFQTLTKPLIVSGARSADAKYKYTDTVNGKERPFVSVAEANSYLPTNQRTTGLTVFINTGGTLLNGVITGGTNSEYQYRDGVANNNLVPKGTSSSRTYTYVLAPSTSVATGVNVANQLTIEKTGTLSIAYINAKTGPVGADLIVDLNINGTSVWNTTQANRLKITAGATTGSQSSFDTVVVTAGQVLTIDVDQVGSTTPGSSVTIQLVVNQ